MERHSQDRAFRIKRNLIDRSWENAVGNNAFSELSDAASQDTKRVRRLLKSVGSDITEEVKGLLPQERAHFVKDLDARYKEHVASERSNNLFLGRLLRNGTIPIACVNSDGTFNVDKLQTESYFQDNPHMVEVLDLHSRQLSEKSKVRKRASAFHSSLQQPIEESTPLHTHEHHAEEQTESSQKETTTHIPMHTSAIAAYEAFYGASLKQARQSILVTPPDDGQIINEDLLPVISDAGERLGIRKIAEVENLTDEQQAIFLHTYQEMFRSFCEKDAILDKQIESLLASGDLPFALVNPDGTFQADKIQELPYFLNTKEGRKAFNDFEFATRQLPEESTYRKEAEKKYAEEHAGHNHEHGEHHHDEESGACCSTHRKKELSMIRTNRKYGKYPRLAMAISKVKELGWLALCPGDDFANLASNVISPLFSGGEGEDHHHEEPNAYVPKAPFAVVHRAKEIQDKHGHWGVVDLETAKIDEYEKVQDMIGAPKHTVHHGHGHGHHENMDNNTPLSAEHESLIDTQSAQVIPLRQRRRRGVSHVAAAAIVVSLGAGATGSGAPIAYSPDEESTATASSSFTIPETQQEGRIQFEMPGEDQQPALPIQETIVFEQVHAGDSQWSMVASAVEDTGLDSHPALVNVLTDITASVNIETNPQPDAIAEGQTIILPSESVISYVDTVLDNSSVDPVLAQDLQDLNTSEEMPKAEKIKNKFTILNRIKEYIVSKFRTSNNLTLAS